MADLSRSYSDVRVGAQVVECMVDTSRPDGPARGHIVEVCTECSDALVRCLNGYEERVPLGRFGRDRPQAHWRVVQ